MAEGQILGPRSAETGSTNGLTDAGPRPVVPRRQRQNRSGQALVIIGAQKKPDLQGVSGPCPTECQLESASVKVSSLNQETMCHSEVSTVRHSHIRRQMTSTSLGRHRATLLTRAIDHAGFVVAGGRPRGASPCGTRGRSRLGCTSSPAPRASMTLRMGSVSTAGGRGSVRALGC